MPKEIRRFTEFGQQEFRKLLLNPTLEACTDLASRLYTSEISTCVVSDVDLPDVPSNRFELAATLYLCQSKGEILNPKDRNLWNWLAASYLCSESINSGNDSHVGDSKRWIVSESQRYEYRHLVLGPYLAYSAHNKNPQAAMCMLAQPFLTPGEVVEQVQGTPEIAYSICAAVATRLYVDPITNQIKTGAGGKGLGSARRLTASYLNQIRVNLDIRGMTEDQLIAILPPEFDRFKSQEGHKQDSDHKSFGGGLFERLRDQLGL